MLPMLPTYNRLNSINCYNLSFGWMIRPPKPMFLLTWSKEPPNIIFKWIPRPLFRLQTSVLLKTFAEEILCPPDGFKLGAFDHLTPWPKAKIYFFIKNHLTNIVQECINLRFLLFGNLASNHFFVRGELFELKLIFCSFVRSIDVSILLNMLQSFNPTYHLPPPPSNQQTKMSIFSQEKSNNTKNQTRGI